MPHFIYANRYWRFAGDEIFVAGFLASFWRTVWTAVLLMLLLTNLHRLSQCSSGWLIISYLSASIAALILSIIVEILLVNVSLKGTIIESEKRSGLGFYLTAHAFLGLIQFLLTFFGFAVISANSEVPCAHDFHDRIDMLLLSIVVISQFVDVLSMMCCCYAFSARKVSEGIENGDSSSDSESEEEEEEEEGHEKVGQEGEGEKGHEKVGQEGELERLESGVGAAGASGAPEVKRFNILSDGNVTAIANTNTNVNASVGTAVASTMVTRTGGTSHRVRHHVRHRHNRHQSDDIREIHAAHVSVWETRCRSITRNLQLLSCNVFGGSGHMEADFTAVARVLTTFFQHSGFLDVVPSDVAAGLCLVRLQQRFELPLGLCDVDELATSAPVIAGGSVITTTTATPAAAAKQPFKSTQSNPNYNSTGHTKITITTTTDASVASTATTTTATSLGPSITASAEFTAPAVAPTSTSQPLSMQSMELSTSDIGFQLDTEHHPHIDDLSIYKRQRLEGRRVLSSRSHQDQAIIAKAFHYSVYALALYTQLIYIYMHPVTGPCRLCGCCAPCECCCFPVSAAGAGAFGVDNDHGHGDAEGDIETGTAGYRHHQQYEPPGPTFTVGDNRFSTHHAAVTRILGMFGKGAPVSEIRHLSLINTTYAKPYGIFIDHLTRAVVVAIRGTLSLEDCLTDAMATPVEMKALGEKWGFNGTNKYAHSGMLLAADHLRTELERGGILARIFGREAPQPPGNMGMHHHPCQHAGSSSGCSSGAVDSSFDSTSNNSNKAYCNDKQRSNDNNNNSFSSYNQQRDSNEGLPTSPLCEGLMDRADMSTYPDYKLVITGHSLGAATAVLLSMLLRPVYPSLECVTFGTPGAVVDEATAHSLKSYVTSVCLGSDIIPRTNIHSLAALREDTLDCLARSKVNKFTITRSMFAEKVELSDVLYRRGEEPDSAFKRGVDKYKQHIRAQMKACCGNIPLCIPGFVLHLMRTHRSSTALGSSSICNNNSNNNNHVPTTTTTTATATLSPSLSPSPVSDNNMGVGRRQRSHRFTPVEAHSPVDFSTIMVSPTMVLDHLPDRYVYELQSLYQRFTRVPMTARRNNVPVDTLVATDI